MKLRFTPEIAILIFAILTPVAIIAQALINFPLAVHGFAIPAGHLFELIITSTVVITTFSGVIISYLFAIDKIKSWTIVPLLASFFTLGLYGLGTGIHFTANSLHHFIITNKISGELQAIAYFYDEQLSHVVWIPSLIMFPVCILLWEFVMSRRHLKFGWLSLVPGIWYGVFTGIIVLESQLIKLALPLLFLLGGSAAILLVSRKSLLKSSGGIFAVTSLVLIGITIIGWRILTGGFPEPLDVLF